MNIDGGSIWLWKVADKVLRDIFSILTIIDVVLRKKAWRDKWPVSMVCV